MSSYSAGGGALSGEVSIEGLLSLSVQVAFECGNRQVACSALEALVVSHDQVAEGGLGAMRCLVRLKLTLIEGLNVAESQEVRRQVSKLIGQAYQQLEKRASNGNEDISVEVCVICATLCAKYCATFLTMCVPLMCHSVPLVGGLVLTRLLELGSPMRNRLCCNERILFSVNATE